MCLSHLALELETPPAVLSGMLDTLVGMGLIARLDQLDTCGDCPLKFDCRVLPVPDRVYMKLIDRLPEPGGDVGRT
jgi:hypothetical protein